MTEERLYLYPLWLRIWHGVNGLCILILIITGVVMHWAIHGPNSNLATTVHIHNITGVVLSVSYVFFVIGNIVFLNSRYYRIKMKGLRQRLTRQAKYYMSGMFKGEQPPFPINEKRKFNPLQKYSYIFLMYMLVPLVVATGYGLLFPETIIEKVYEANGVFLTALFHAALGFLISIFLLVHLYVASIGKHPLRNFKSIINGWHESHH